MRNILSLACDTDQKQPALSWEQFTRATAKVHLQNWTEVLERAADLVPGRTGGPGLRDRVERLALLLASPGAPRP